MERQHFGGSYRVQAPTPGTDKLGEVWGYEKRSESSLGRMGSVFTLFIYLRMKGGSWFKPTTIFSDFWAEGRQRTGEEGV